MSVELVAPTCVLNVNDDPAARYLATKVLRRAGFDVIEADTGLTAVREARARRPQLAVLDVRLPDISGLEVCRALKSDPATASILIVQTSASFVTSANKAAGLSAGADAYLTQPFDAEELVATLNSLMRGRRQETEARERADALTLADRRKDEFLAMLAHELRNPLSAILTAARLMQTTDRESSPRLAATIERQAQHLASLVEDLLDISRITHGKIQLECESLNVIEAIERAIETVKPALARNRCDLRLACCEGPVLVRADPVRLEQIFCNLLTNAIKYGHAEGRIDVRVECVSAAADTGTGGKRARITIADDGVGLTRQDREHIFDLFYQADTSIARSQSGLGIGLTMVKRLVEMHGGTIAVESEGLGRGAAFSIELPRIDPPSGTRVAQAPPGSVEGTRVLFVDDNVDACELMKICLEMAGCIVTTAFDGGQAVRLATEKRFDVVVLDIGLPVLDGYRVAATIVEQLGTTRPRLVALTGYDRIEDRGRAKRMGFDAHLVKPADSETLLRTIGDVLQGSRVTFG